jgi:hypothetical protein
MADYFTNEVGKMRSREMVARGIRYQAAAAAQRKLEPESCLKAPHVDKPVHYRRLLVLRHRSATA